MRHGSWPTIKQFPSIDDELKSVEREVRRLQTIRASHSDRPRYGLHEIAVLLPTAKAVERARSFFGHRGFRTNAPELTARDIEASLLIEDHLNITNLQKVRGLEFKVVFMCQLQALPPYFDPQKDTQQDEEEKLIQRSRWLYVGMTRAREMLHLSYQNPPTTEPQSLLQSLDGQRSNAIA